MLVISVTILVNDKIVLNSISKLYMKVGSLLVRSVNMRLHIIVLCTYIYNLNMKGLDIIAISVNMLVIDSKI